MNPAMIVLVFVAIAFAMGLVRAGSLRHHRSGVGWFQRRINRLVEGADARYGTMPIDQVLKQRHRHERY